jgi:hypothetical protein
MVDSTIPTAEENRSPKRPIDDWVIAGGDVDAWENLFDAGLVRLWAYEVDQGLKSPVDQGSWSLIGTNVLIEHDDPGDALQMLRRVAAEADLGFVCVPAEAVVEHVDGLRTMLEAAAPVLAMLDWGEWSWREDDASLAFARRLFRQLQPLDAKRPVLFVLCAESADVTCSELLRVGG